MTALDTLVGRRQVLKGMMIAGPTLAIAARIGLPDGAAGAFPTKTDEAPDIQDFTDIFVASETPTIYDLLIEIKPDNRVYFELPRQETDLPGHWDTAQSGRKGYKQSRPPQAPWLSAHGKSVKQQTPAARGTRRTRGTRREQFSLRILRFPR